jgi:hypothetical protein
MRLFRQFPIAVCGAVDPHRIAGARRSRGTNTLRCIVNRRLDVRPPSCPSCVRAPAVLLWIGMKQAQRQEREEILPLGHKTRPAREKRTAKGVGGGCEAAPLRAHKGGCGRGATR